MPLLQWGGNNTEVKVTTSDSKPSISSKKSTEYYYLNSTEQSEVTKYPGDKNISLKSSILNQMLYLKGIQ